MKIEGTHTFAAPREIVWPMLLDPEVLASVLPGCSGLEQIGDNKYQGTLNIRVGPVQGKFNGTVTLTDLNAPEGYHLAVDGRGVPGFVKGSGSLRLLQEDGETVMQYEGDAQVGGRLASVGQRLLDTSARAIIRQSLEGIDQHVSARAKAEASGEEAIAEIQPVTPPSQADFAFGVAKNMLEELLSPEQREMLVSKVLPILGAMLLILMLDQWRMNRLASRVAKLVSKKGGALQ